MSRDGNYRNILPFLRKNMGKICLSTIIFACPRLDQTYRLVKIGKIQNFPSEKCQKISPVHQNFYLSRTGRQSVISIPAWVQWTPIANPNFERFQSEKPKGDNDPVLYQEIWGHQNYVKHIDAKHVPVGKAWWGHWPLGRHRGGNYGKVLPFPWKSIEKNLPVHHYFCLSTTRPDRWTN